jgi:hypothetical protein
VRALFDELDRFKASSARIAWDELRAVSGLAEAVGQRECGESLVRVVERVGAWSNSESGARRSYGSAPYFNGSEAEWQVLVRAVAGLSRGRLGLDSARWARVFRVMSPHAHAHAGRLFVLEKLFAVFARDVAKGLLLTPELRGALQIAPPILREWSNAPQQQLALKMKRMAEGFDEKSESGLGRVEFGAKDVEGTKVAKKKTKDVVATIDEPGALALINAFVKAAEPDAYSAAHIGAAEEIQRILSLNEADQRVVVVALCGILTELHGRHCECLTKGKSSSWDKSPWQRERGIAKSILMERLLKRKHDFTAPEVVSLIGSMGSNGDHVWSSYIPGVVGALERFASSGPMPPKVVEIAADFHKQMRSAGGNANRLLAERIGKCLLDDTSGAEQPSQEPTAAERVLLNRADIVDNGPWLLDVMSAALVLPPETSRTAAVQFGPVEHPSFSRETLEFHNRMLEEAKGRYTGGDRGGTHVVVMQKAIEKAKGPGLATSAAALVAMSLNPLKYDFDSERAQRFYNGLDGLLDALTNALEKVPTIDPGSLGEVCHSLSRFRRPEYSYPEWTRLAEAIAKLVRTLNPPLSDSQMLRILRLRERLARSEGAHDRAGVQELDRALGIDTTYGVELGDRWSDRMVKDLHAMSAARRGAWMRAIEQGKACKGSAPSAKWIKGAEAVLKDLPRAHFEEMLNTWFPLVGKPRPSIAGGKISGRDSTVPTESGADVLRALAMMAGRVDTPGSARALGDLAMACFKMVPGVGARCIRPGTAALHGLSSMSTPAALSQLSRLRQLVKFGTAKKMLDTSLDRLAAQLGVTTSELHEMAAPDFGLDADGKIIEEAGDFTLELVASTGGADVRVLDSKGAVRKSVPDVVKKEHGEALKTLKQAQGDIDKMLEAQRARIDSMFVEDRRWTVPQWKERYIEHPLMGVLGRRLIWRIVDDPKSADLGRAVLWAG